MLYIGPFTDTITVEFRRYRLATPDTNFTTWQWAIRNYVWEWLGPGYAHFITTYVPIPSVRDWLLDTFFRGVSIILASFIRGRNTAATDQQIRYPEMGYGDDSRYIFSIWAFPEETYIDSLRQYFRFCRDYYQKTGYRFNITSVGYRIRHDTSSLFSYSYNGPVMTFDPVSTGNPGWDDFLRAYNELSSGLGGTPLFNQTNLLTREQVNKAFGDRVAKFESYRKQYDPTGRLVNPYFRELLGSGE
jgi:hypothetical protein